MKCPYDITAIPKSILRMSQKEQDDKNVFREKIRSGKLRVFLIWI